MRQILAVASLAAAVYFAGPAALADEPPSAPKRPVEDSYHGVVVTDEYRWLEDWSDPAVQTWSAGQSDYARRFLDGLPNVDAIRVRVNELMAATVRYRNLAHVGGQLFALKSQPPLEQPLLVVASSPGDAAAARLVVDPNAIDPSGLTTIDWYRPSPDGKIVAVSLSTAGTEIGNLRLFDVARATEVYERVQGVNSGTAGGSLAWSADARGFYYTRHLAGASSLDGRSYQHVYYHELGTDPSADRYELGRGFPEIAEIQLAVDTRTGRALATVQKGDGGEFAHFLRSSAGEWRQFTSFEDGVVQVEFGFGDDLLAVVLAGTPRGRILRVSGATLDVREGKVVVAEAADAIVTGGIAFWGERTVLPTADHLYVTYQLGGPSEIRAFDHEGRKLETPPQLPVSAVHGMLSLGSEGILFANESFLQPSAFYQYDPRTGKTTPTTFADSSIARFDDAEVVRELATSADGTKVPLNIVMPAGLARDGSNPAFVNGYGGFGINQEPAYSDLTRLLLDQGVVFVTTNLRGGAEFGEAWHRAGSLTHKQNVFDDFAAVLEHLIARRYTAPDRLAILGGSNGGLLMGATITQHPKLVKAVYSAVGIYDMLRSELSPNGAFIAAEYGRVRDPEQFEALYAYSPYHRVRDGMQYPATLFATGQNDPRVDPMHSRKMTARLQAAAEPVVPILLRTNSNAGHGGGSALSQQIELRVDVYAFLFAQLGIELGQ